VVALNVAEGQRRAELGRGRCAGHFPDDAIADFDFAAARRRRSVG
jgi:hypothetical protein